MTKYQQEQSIDPIASREQFLASQGKKGLRLLRDFRRTQNELLLPERGNRLPANAAATANEAYQKLLAKAARSLGYVDPNEKQ